MTSTADTPKRPPPLPRKTREARRSPLPILDEPFDLAEARREIARLTAAMDVADWVIAHRQADLAKAEAIIARRGELLRRAASKIRVSVPRLGERHEPLLDAITAEMAEEDDGG